MDSPEKTPAPATTPGDPIPGRPRSRWKGPLIRLSIFYAALCLGLYLFQERLLYRPTRLSLDGVRQKAGEAGLTLWPVDGPDHRGFLAEPGDGEPAGTVVIFHGNAGDALDRDFLVPLLRRQGLRVLILEYPGYGARPGPLSEEAIVADTTESMAMASREFDGPLYLFAESLGAGVAAATVKRSDVPVDGIVLATPWDTLPDLAARRFWFVPARLLVKDSYDSVTNLQGYDGPVAVIIAAEDEVIPRANSQRLYDALGRERRLWVLPGCGHNTWPAVFGMKEAREVMEFLSRDPAGPGV